ncbi:MAG TPA: three-Cys-motif partner protein TcmP [Pyrinomonadaceae bacterium]|jgi:three-Cys-motif partner protein
MKRDSRLKFDEIGYWSEVKLEIIKLYAAEYSKILTAQQRPKLHHVYIDAFAGAGVHISKTSQGFVPGSPLNALMIRPPFREFYLIDLDSKKVDALRQIIGERADVHIYSGNCNEVLLNQVFPKVRYDQFRRGLCLLDPYGMHLSWEVMKTAGEMKSLDIFLNFPIMDMNRNAIWGNPDRVGEAAIARMNTFWGDESWREIAYTTERGLFGILEKEDNEKIVEGFRERLRKVAGFNYVPKPIPMRNTKGAVVYYLFFASQKAVADKIIQHIFNKYRSRGAA